MGRTITIDPVTRIEGHAKISIHLDANGAVQEARFHVGEFRGFEAFCFNPLSGFKIDFLKIEIVNFYNDVKWYFPKMKNSQLLATPTRLGEKPD